MRIGRITLLSLRDYVNESFFKLFFRTLESVINNKQKCTDNAETQELYEIVFCGRKQIFDISITFS